MHIVCDASHQFERNLGRIVCKCVYFFDVTQNTALYCVLYTLLDCNQHVREALTFNASAKHTWRVVCKTNSTNNQFHETPHSQHDNRRLLDGSPAVEVRTQIGSICCRRKRR